MSQKKNSAILRVAIPLLLMVTPIVYSVVKGVATRAPDDPGLFLEISREISDSCVRDTEYMRFHHWELLKEMREQVVRNGHREEMLLEGCTKCHPHRDRFCDRCHAVANVRLDCFHCHYYPTSPDPTSADAGPVRQLPLASMTVAARNDQ